MKFIKLALGSFFLASQVTAAPIPGTTVDIKPPTGFSKAERFPGFMNEAIGASIMISEIPGPYNEVASGFTDQRMQAQGMKLLNKLSVKVDGQPAILLDVEQVASGVLFKKWLLAVDRSSSTTLIVATYPNVEAKQQQNLLKATVLGATLGKQSAPREALSFTAIPIPPFQNAKTIGQTLILSPGGKFPLKDENMPFMVLSLSTVKELAIPDKRAFAESRVIQTATIKNIKVDKSSPVKIGTLSGFTTLAEGKGEYASTPLTIYQVVLFDVSGYYLILGVVPLANKDMYLPIFEKIAKTFTLKV